MLEELRAICDHATRKIDLLRGMQLDAERFLAEYDVEGRRVNPEDEVESMEDRILWALEIVTDQVRSSESLITYFEISLKEVSVLSI